MEKALKVNKHIVISAHLFKIKGLSSPSLPLVRELFEDLHFHNLFASQSTATRCVRPSEKLAFGISSIESPLTGFINRYIFRKNNVQAGKKTAEI